VTLFERDRLMQATSRTSSKLLHGGLRYLENGEFRLVREALRERDAWLKRAPELARPLRLLMPVYRASRRPRIVVATGLFLYDRLAGKSMLPGARWRSAAEILANDPGLNPDMLVGGYEFSDGQMDDYALGLWVADQAAAAGVRIVESAPVSSVDAGGTVVTAGGERSSFDRVLNVAGPWAARLLEESGIPSPYQLDLVRGSHIVLAERCTQAYLLEVPGERRIFFVLPWKQGTLVGTTEVRQRIDEPIACTDEEQAYLLAAHRHYWPGATATVTARFAGVRPLLRSAADPNRATREYAIHRTGNLISVFGGKWTTAMALAHKVEVAAQ
jgi:glycerol-3-phosphate dehydrogenase